MRCWQFLRSTAYATALVLASGCATPDQAGSQTVYVAPDLPREQVAIVFIEDRKGIFEDATAVIAAVDNLEVNAKQVVIRPGRHRLAIDVRYPNREVQNLMATMAAIAGALAGAEMSEEDEEVSLEPDSYFEYVIVDTRPGRRYKIVYQEEQTLGYDNKWEHKMRARVIDAN